MFYLILSKMRIYGFTIWYHVWFYMILENSMTLWNNHLREFRTISTSTRPQNLSDPSLPGVGLGPADRGSAGLWWERLDQGRRIGSWCSQTKRGWQRTAPIFPTPVDELPVSDSPVRVANVTNFPNFVHQVPKGGLYQHNIAWWCRVREVLSCAALWGSIVLSCPAKIASWWGVR